MKSVSEIKGLIADLSDELDAITAVSEREERDLSSEETNRCDDITATLLPSLRKQLKTAINIERERHHRHENRLDEMLKEKQAVEGTPEATLGHSDPNIARFHTMKIPAKCKSHGTLRAYQGPEADKHAFIAGNVILAGVFGNESATKFCRNYGLQVQGALYSGDNSKGGFVVPDEMQATLIRLRESRGVFPQFANRIPMGADIIRVPRLLSDVTAYWTGEQQEITASDTTLGSAELMAKKLAALTKVSSELDEDAVIEVGDMITESMAYAMADKIDEAAFNGDGTSTYGGVLGLKNALHANAIQDAAASNDSALELDLADFEACIGKYPQYSGASPRWFVHSAVYWASMARLMNAAGGNTNVTLADGPPQLIFMGYPVEFVQVMPSTTGTLASTIVAYFGDLRLGASYGVRRSSRTEVTLDRYFEEDMIGIKTTERIAINIHERGETIRTRPIVALKTSS